MVLHSLLASILELNLPFAMFLATDHKDPNFKVLKVIQKEQEYDLSH
jgi:hypothetical protein